MERRTATLLAWFLFGFTALAFAGGIVFSLLNATSGAEIGPAVLALVMFSFPIVGVLVATRHPHNSVGWILLAIGFAWGFADAFMKGYIRYAYVTEPGSLPAPDVLAALHASAWVPGVGLIGTFLILLFPDGRLPSERWRPLARLSAFVLVVVTALTTMTPGSIREVAQLDFLPADPNPLGVAALRSLSAAAYWILPLLPLCMIASAVAMIGRFRRSQGRERLQLKWFSAGAGLTATLYMTAVGFSLAFDSDWSGIGSPAWLTLLQNFSLFSFVLIPIAAGIAILRYRLYDIDVIINRALVYGALTGTLALLYAAGVVTTSALARLVTRQETNDLAVAASTLAVAALFRPVRRNLQSFIDRRFYRRKYDAEKTLDRFSARLRDEVDLDALNSDVIGVVAATMQPRHASMWLRPLAR
ncbi:MAG TPA: hypothetical protein VM573_09725 [Actinomycetota bacterium]|jgi:hypothetical protein|nr:hypothetical protein [Actinomycetota bacterium]